ncbi:MAG: DNA polymerase/3'-5' exonuclease PolX [Patescibacteria group bacterium]|nr:DNA polymerase/3'-5' exonuclease PolX [Patescibacteria group bacterium]
MNISNQEIAGILYEISEYLEMENIQFKPRAYQKAASAIESLSENISDIYKKGGLKAVMDIPNVGASIAEKLEELIKTGRLEYYQKLKKRVPVDLKSLEFVEGLGPKGIKKLNQELGVRNLNDLEKAAKEKKIRAIKGFGEKAEKNILKSIEFAKKSGSKFILGSIMPEISEIVDQLGKLKEVERVDIVGSVRRKRETIGDIDILIISQKPKPVMDYFVNMTGIERIYSHGESKSGVKYKNGMDIDLRVVPQKSYGAALMYFTGSKDHNIELRKTAIKKGYKLNEYGLFKGDKIIAGETEEEIYEKLEIDYIEPEMRENQGEIELAQKHQLPALIDYGDLKGDLHIHSDWTDGLEPIEVIANEAAKRGLQYIAITDHTKRLAMTGGLDEKLLLNQIAEIDKINQRLTTNNQRLKILKGSEVDILKDGSLDLSDKILEKLDIVGASIHSQFNLSKEEQTKRIIKAIKNKNVDIICHPTGRILNQRPAYELDIDEIIKAAKRTNTVLEINAYPNRLDLKDKHIKKCVQAGVKLVISTDLHASIQMDYLKWGIAQARRGWATKSDIINARPLEKMLKMLK